MTRARATHRRVARPLIGVVAAAAGVIALANGPTASAAPAAAPTPIYLDTHYTFAERAADLVSRMTLPEKVGQLHTNSAPAIPRLGVQQYTYWSEGQHGLNTLGADTNHGHRTPAACTRRASRPTSPHDVLGSEPDLPGDDGDLRRGPRLAGQVAVGHRPEQPRPRPRTTTAP